MGREAEEEGRKQKADAREEAEEKQKRSRSSSRVRPTAGNAKKNDRRSIVQIDAQLGCLREKQKFMSRLRPSYHGAELFCSLRSEWQVIINCVDINVPLSFPHALY